MGEDSDRGAATTGRRRTRDDDHAATTTAPPFLPPKCCHRTAPMRGHDDAATTRRRRRQPRCRCSPGSQSLQPPRSQSLQCPGRHRSFRRRYSPSLAAAPSLQVPSQSLQPPSLTGLTAPLTQEDGWWRRGRRRDDDAALVVGTGRKGRRVTLISKAHSSVQNLGMGAQTADHWVQSARGAAFWTGWSSRR